MAEETDDVLLLALDHSELIRRLQEGPLYKGSLAQELDISSKTVYRRACKLIKADLIERCQNGYRLTEIGYFYSKFIKSLYSISDNIKDLSPLLRRLPPEEYPPHWFFADVNAVSATETKPLRPVEKFESVFKNANRLCALLPAVPTRYLKLLDRRTEEDALTAELIVASEAVSDLKQCYEGMNKVLTEDSQLWQVADVPYGLVAVTKPKPAVFLVVHNDMGVVTGIIESRNPVATSWALQKFGRYLATATRPKCHLPV